MTDQITTLPSRRGTSNSNARGNSVDRRRRREWLVENYRANADLPFEPSEIDALLGGFPLSSWQLRVVELPPGQGVPACRCYRCGCLLTVETVTVDRIIPGCKGGTYRRSNIRPACAHCNSETGGKLAHEGKNR